MNFEITNIAHLTVVTTEPVEDERGYFMRTFSTEEFESAGLDFNVSIAALSYNQAELTLRGMHYQAPPWEERKLVRCARGRIYDVVIDLRSESPSYREWFGIELSETVPRSLYVPAGCAHGFLTLEPDTEVLYAISGTYQPSHARGVRWNDPHFAIDWPREPTTMSSRDRTYPDFER